MFVLVLRSGVVLTNRGLMQQLIDFVSQAITCFLRGFAFSLMLELGSVAFLLRHACWLVIADEEVFMAKGVQKAGLALFAFRPDGLDGVKTVLVLEKIFWEASSSSRR